MSIDATTITLSSKAAEGMTTALEQDFCRMETPERMAWIVLLLREIEDDEIYFPMGKWATIQSIERQLDQAATDTIRKLREDEP